MNFLAVDLGGTRLKAALMAHGESVPSDPFSIEHGGDWRGGLHTAVDHFGEVGEIAACVPGLVDNGRVVALPGKLPGLVDADLQAELGMPVLLTNDAVAYAIGEAVHGAGRSHQRVVVVTIGTGLGVGVVEDGEPLGHGPLGGGILSGQVLISDPDAGPSDTSGRRGTFEALCRASSLLAEIPAARDLPEAYELLRAGDEGALVGFAAYREWLTRGLSMLALAHAPSVIVIGGGAAQPGLLDGVQEALAPRLWQGQGVEVRPGELGDSAALAGLGALWRQADE
ncbi:MAG TPA: ROK family protein [Acidimicrobiales bacterium]|nr:ROK family protein [Acidimicrobiales bacterium]